MRLIDDFVYRKSILKECEKLKKELEEAIENEDHEVVLAIRNQLSAFELAIKLIDLQPTAYDIDKVVDELAKGYVYFDCSNVRRKANNDAIRKAIKIVRVGGKECM